MLEDIKLFCRISSNAFDRDVMHLMESCAKDLSDAGISYDVENPKHILATKYFVKMNFGDIDEKVYERTRKAYQNIKINLSVIEVGDESIG